MVRHVLSSKYNVQATVKSFYSSARDLKYLLGIDDSTGAEVFEMGVASPGELATSCKYFKPQIRILLNIGVYHLDGCKTP